MLLQFLQLLRTQNVPVYLIDLNDAITSLGEGLFGEIQNDTRTLSSRASSISESPSLYSKLKRFFPFPRSTSDRPSYAEKAPPRIEVSTNLNSLSGPFFYEKLFGELDWTNEQEQPILLTFDLKHYSLMSQGNDEQSGSLDFAPIDTLNWFSLLHGQELLRLVITTTEDKDFPLLVSLEKSGKNVAEEETPFDERVVTLVKNQIEFTLDPEEKNIESFVPKLSTQLAEVKTASSVSPTRFYDPYYLLTLATNEKLLGEMWSTMRKSSDVHRSKEAQTLWRRSVTAEENFINILSNRYFYIYLEQNPWYAHLLLLKHFHPSPTPGLFLSASPREAETVRTTFPELQVEAFDAPLTIGAFQQLLLKQLVSSTQQEKILQTKITNCTKEFSV